MTKNEYIRKVDNAKTAVLFIHGILGTPYHFRDLLPLVPDSFSVHNLVLDGHGKDIEAFAQTSMKKWETQAEKCFCDLADTHENVILVGHSMGTLLSIDLAMKHPDKVSFLYLLNVPLTPRTTYNATMHSYRVIFEKVREDKAHEVAARDAYGIEVDRRLWLYPKWLPRFIELFVKADDTRKKLSLIKPPAIAFQSRHDELVSNQSEKILRKHPHIEVIALENSTHYFYTEEDKEIFKGAFIKICEKFK